MAKWLTTLFNTSNVSVNAQIGCYQGTIHSDSNGSLYFVTIETVAGNSRIRIYSNNTTIAESNYEFNNGVTWALINESCIANGYTADTLVSVIEIASVLFGDRIYVAVIHTHPVSGHCIEIIEFQLTTNANSAKSLIIYNPLALGVDTTYKSIDIAVTRHRGYSHIWVSFIQTGTALPVTMRLTWFEQMIPPEPQLAGTAIYPIQTYIQGEQSLINNYLAIVDLINDNWLFSISFTHFNVTNINSAIVPAGGIAL